MERENVEEREGEERDDREHIVNLLKRGNKMLAEHCPKCGSPLFWIKEKGLKYCPKCRVYLATEKEIEEGGIDRERVYDFERYWEKKTGEGKGQAEVEKKKVRGPSKERQEPPTRQKEWETRQSVEITGEVDALIRIILRKVKEKVKTRDVPVERLMEWLEILMNLRKT